MKFILHIEDTGYQIRFWDEINETMGESIACSWKKNELYSILNSKGFKINKSELINAFKLLDEENKPFVVFTSQEDESLDTFSNDFFVIDKNLTKGEF